MKLINIIITLLMMGSVLPTKAQDPWIIRLRFSQDLLKMGKSITEIAYVSGFTSVSYYSKCYKDFFNETPTQYQDRHLK